MKPQRITLVKTRPDRLPALHRAIHRHPDSVVVACGEYVWWRLKRETIPSLRLESFAPSRGIAVVHRDLERRFSSLVTASAPAFPWLDADLLKNHFTWQIQPAYRLATAALSLASARRLTRVLWEKRPGGAGLAPSADELVIRALTSEGISCGSF